MSEPIVVEYEGGKYQWTAGQWLCIAGLNNSVIGLSGVGFGVCTVAHLELCRKARAMGVDSSVFESLEARESRRKAQEKERRAEERALRRKFGAKKTRGGVRILSLI